MLRMCTYPLLIKLSAQPIFRASFGTCSSCLLLRIRNVARLNSPSLVQQRYTSKEPGYTSFGHGRTKMQISDIVLFGAMGFMSIFLLYACVKADPERFRNLFEGRSANKSSDMDSEKRVLEELANEELSEDLSESKDVDHDEVKQQQKKPKMTFRDKKIISYENKLRAFSTPEKTFRYFATLKVYPVGESPHGPNFEVFMTPDDFVRSITPGVMQPEGLGLEQFTTFNPETDALQYHLDDDSVFYKLGKHGLISYTDYIFLLTLLSTSARHFTLAFKMFDINGDGELDYNEFEMVESVIRNQTQIGVQHRDRSSTGTVLRRHTNSLLAAYFFGPNLDQKLTIDRFLEFQDHLQRDVLKLEFERRRPKSGRISEMEFCKMLLQHSNLPAKNQQYMLKRVKKLYAYRHNNTKANNGNHSETKALAAPVGGLTFDEVANFFRFLNSITDVETALTFYRIAGAPVDAPTLQHVARAVTGFRISDDVIECVFALFDENQDGELSNREFINVMKRRLLRGLERPKDTGFVRIIAAGWHCGWDAFHLRQHQNR